MRHFQRLAEGLDVFPLLHAIQRQPELWDEFPIRTTHPYTPHGDVSDILCMFNDLNQEPGAIIDDREVIPFPAWVRLPQLRPLVFNLMRAVESTRLGRVIVTRLPPGKCITPHVDGGAPATWYTRYQVCLQASPGNLFRAGDETIGMKAGEAWWFDNQQEHEVINNGADDRIVVIVDLRVE